MDPILIHTTDTTKFLLPLVVKDGYTYKDIQTNLIGSYISIAEMPTYDQSIIVIFNEDIKLDCLKDNYIDDFIIFNSEHDTTDSIFIYKIEDDLLDDYIKFISGDYSQLSDSTKEKILQFWQAKEDTFIYSILYKHQEIIKRILLKERTNKNPWNSLYLIWKDRLRKNKELYRTPNLLKEMYSYNSEV